MGLMTALDRHSLGCYQDFGSQLPRAAISWRLFDRAGSRTTRCWRKAATPRCMSWQFSKPHHLHQPESCSLPTANPRHDDTAAGTLSASSKGFLVPQQSAVNTEAQSDMSSPLGEHYALTPSKATWIRRTPRNQQKDDFDIHSIFKTS
jgi:hypothetical protein